MDQGKPVILNFSFAERLYLWSSGERNSSDDGAHNEHYNPEYEHCNTVEHRPTDTIIQAWFTKACHPRKTNQNRHTREAKQHSHWYVFEFVDCLLYSAHVRVDHVVLSRKSETVI